MTKHLLIGIVLVTFPLIPTFAQILPTPPLLSVSGAAEVKVAPDEIHLRVGAETRGDKVDDARRLNEESVAKALAFLKASGVEDKNVQTDFLSIEPNYDDNYSRTKPVIYVVRKSIEIKLTKIEGFEAILTGLLSNGITNVHGIDFRTSELRKHRDEARALAIRAAKEKAEAMAAELGVKCGKVYSVNANDGGGWWGLTGSYWGRGGGAQYQNIVQNVGGPSEGEDGALSVGQISVNATVSVSFQIE